MKQEEAFLLSDLMFGGPHPGQGGDDKDPGKKDPDKETTDGKTKSYQVASKFGYKHIGAVNSPGSPHVFEKAGAIGDKHQITVNQDGSWEHRYLHPHLGPTTSKFGGGADSLENHLGKFHFGPKK